MPFLVSFGTSTVTVFLLQDFYILSVFPLRGIGPPQRPFILSFDQLLVDSGPVDDIDGTQLGVEQTVYIYIYVYRYIGGDHMIRFAWLKGAFPKHIPTPIS